MSDQWMYRVVGAEFGPVPQEELQQLLQEGLVGEDDEVRPADQSHWRPANTWAELGYQVASRAASTATAERGVDEWYCKTFGTELGPLSFDELLRMAENSEIAADDEVRLGSSGKWRRVGSIGRLMAALPYQEAKREVVAKPEPVVLDRDTSVGQATISAPAVAASRVAGSPSAPVTVDEAWYASIKGVQYGPVAFTQLAGWMKTGQLSAQDFVRQGPQGEFTAVSSIPELAPPPARPAAPVAPVRTMEPEPIVERPVAVAAIEPAAPTPPPSYAASASMSSPAAPAPAWGSSTGGFSSAAPAFNRPAPAPAKKSSSSSSGGGLSLPSLDFGALFKNPAILGGLAVAVLVALWFVLPASQKADIEIYNKQKAWLTELQSAQKDNKLASLSSKFEAEAKVMTTDLTKRLNTSYPQRKFLMWNAKYRLAEIVGQNPKKAEQALKEFEGNLKQAAQFLKIKD